MIRLLLVDDHKIIRDGLKALLSNEADIEIVGECCDGSEVLDFVRTNEVDVIMMDINMPKMNGIEATKQVTDAFPEVKVIALTMHNEDSYISKVLKAGALGYVLKNTGRKELVTAIHKVLEDGNYFTDEVASIMMAKYMKKSTSSKQSTVIVNLEDLTRREIEILRLIADEMTNNEIAERLYISPRTVDTHRRNLLQKLAVKNTAGLVKFAIQNGLSD